MRTVLTIVRREYLERVRSRWFVAGTLGAPVLAAVLIVVPTRLASARQDAERSVVVVDEAGGLAARTGELLESGGWRVEVAGPGRGLPALREGVRAGEVGVVLALDEETLRTGRARLLASSPPSPLAALTLRQAVLRATLERQLDGRGVDVGSLLEGGGLDVEVVREGGAGREEPRFLVAFAGAFLLYMVILVYAVAVMRAVLEEKAGRMVEIVLASVRPWQLMLGKVLGVGAVGLTQLGVWIVLGTLLALVALPAALAGVPEAELATIRDAVPGPGFVALFGAFFLGGYFLWAALYAAVGAMCSTEEEAQQAQLPLMFLLLVPALLLVRVLEEPASLASVLLSLVPFFAPVLMFARAVGGGAPGWQVAASLVLVGVAVVGVSWVAGRIYRVGVLMTGKRPTLRELWRWVRLG